MFVTQRKRAFGTFKSQEDAEEAMKILTDSGFAMEKISLIAKQLETTDEIALYIHPTSI